MKIYPIVSFKSASFKQDVKKKEISSQENSVGRNSLEILGNYNRGGILTFRGKSAKEIQKEVEKTLDSRGFRRETTISTICSISSVNSEVAQVQKEIIDTILTVPQMGGFGISLIINSIGDDLEIAQLKKDFISKLAQNKNFDSKHIENITQSLRGDNEESIQYKSEILDEFIKNPNLKARTISAFFDETDYDSKELIDLKKDFYLALSQNEKLTADDIIYTLSRLNKRNDDVISIQIDLGKTLLKNDGFNPQRIANLFPFISDNEEVAQIQCNLIKTLVKNDDFDEGDIQAISSSFKYCTPQNALPIRDLVLELIKNENLDGRGISTLASGFDLDEKVSEKQQDFILKLLREGFYDDPSTIQENIQITQAGKLYISKRPDVDINGVFGYMKQIDFEKIKKLAPIVENLGFTGQFGYLGRFIFSDYHYRTDKKTEFSEDDLTYKGDLNELISNNFVSEYSLDELYSVFPLTTRRIGEIPKGWLDCVPKEKKEEAINQIYDTLLRNSEYCDSKEISQKLTKALGRDVKVKNIGQGAYGECFKISMEGEKDTCFKVFWDGRKDQLHGVHFEPQMGLFVNKHSSDFVKMYFGAVAPGDLSDGFLVTQYLGDDVGIDEPDCTNEGKYNIFSADAYEKHNMIQDKIFDFGAVKVQDKEKYESIKPFDIFSTAKA